MKRVGEERDYHCFKMRRDAEWNMRKLRVAVGSREIEEKKQGSCVCWWMNKGLVLIER